MLSGFFRVRSREPNRPAASLLADLLRARSLEPHRFLRRCTVGPFIVEHACPARAVIVELQRHSLDTDAQRQARLALLEQLGYRIVIVTEREVRSAPKKVLAKVRAALQ
jgi:very-short-patch-repair endonuclease